MRIDALSLSSVGWSALAITLIVRPGVQNCGGCHAEKLLRWVFNAAQKQTVDRSIQKNDIASAHEKTPQSGVLKGGNLKMHPFLGAVSCFSNGLERVCDRVRRRAKRW
ncbi:hypothetical protein [Acidovorax sp. 56]|uniref:hypothetical protein n=1 Tax=Acidovorax sp. 56 TaxID=2035205 RepID=UPI001177BD04|nr:hypothetical protein [Acidovorax sp. 56]